MDELILFINNNYQKIDPVILSGIFHKQLVIIHPFIDGNGRTARLLMNLVLLTSGYGIVCIPPIARATYLHYVEISRKDKNHFVEP